MKQFKALSVNWVPVLIVGFAVLMVSCGENAEAPGTNSSSANSSGTSPKATGTEAPSAKAETVPGWQKATYENIAFSVPKEWKGNEDSGIWCPGDQSLDMGRPKVSLHCGAIPVLPGSSIEDKLKYYYGEAPTTVEKVKKCGMDGMFVEVTVRGVKHLGLILIEDSGIKIINFFDCQAPEEAFDELKETFKKLLNSLGGK